MNGEVTMLVVKKGQFNAFVLQAQMKVKIIMEGKRLAMNYGIPCGP